LNNELAGLLSVLRGWDGWLRKIGDKMFDFAIAKIIAQEYETE
jgi:hypothetical protein